MKNVALNLFYETHGISTEPIALDTPPLLTFGDMSGERLEFVCRLAKGKDVLEIGTFLGVTTYNMSKYANKVVTLDIDNGGTDFNYTRYIVGAWFIDRNPGNIHIQICDTRTFDFKSLNETFDLILIDGDHSYKGCMDDFTKSLSVLKSGGIILIDDYDFTGGMWPGVKQAVHELLNYYPLYSVSEASFVLYEAL